jgi:hypothetical protein
MCFSLSNSVWAENKCDRTISLDLPLKLEQRSHKSYILHFNGPPGFNDYGKVEYGVVYMTNLLHRLHEIHTEMFLPFTTVTHLEHRVSERLNAINKNPSLASEQEDFCKPRIDEAYSQAKPCSKLSFPDISFVVQGCNNQVSEEDVVLPMDSIQLPGVSFIFQQEISEKEQTPCHSPHTSAGNYIEAVSFPPDETVTRVMHPQSISREDMVDVQQIEEKDAYEGSRSQRNLNNGVGLPMLAPMPLGRAIITCEQTIMYYSAPIFEPTTKAYCQIDANGAQSSLSDLTGPIYLSVFAHEEGVTCLKEKQLEETPTATTTLDDFSEYVGSTYGNPQLVNHFSNPMLEVCVWKLCKDSVPQWISVLVTLRDRQ